jgi:DNA-binding response OmpR family regulator
MSRILVVDDDLDLCDLLARHLRLEGFEVEMAHDGALGVERALSGDHSLVVLDVMLPGLNGSEAGEDAPLPERLVVGDVELDNGGTVTATNAPGGGLLVELRIPIGPVREARQQDGE